LRPADPEDFPYKQYDFTSAEIQSPVASKATLFVRVFAEFDQYLDTDTERKERYSVETLLSYQQEKFNTVPYIFIFGDNESGKTITLDIFRNLDYRPLKGTSIPSADVYEYYGTSNGFTPTLLEDEMEGLEHDSEKLKMHRTVIAKVQRSPE
jgi:hypothetical protein